MQKLPVFMLKPNMVAAENVLDYNRHLILEKGTVLSETLIDRLFANQIVSVTVEDEVVPQAQSAAIPKEHKTQLPDLTISYSERVRQSKEFQVFRENYLASVSNFKGYLNDIVQKNATTAITQMLQDSLNLINATKGNFHIFDMLQNMREYDDDTYAHSMNVALICNVLATWLNWSKENTELATACGLLHDIGKLHIPPEVIRKPSKLSVEEYLQVRTHPQQGYRILKDLNLNVHIQNTALMHHERMDGTGYPLNLRGQAIDKFASLIAIADVYDAMTAKRVYRDALCPFEVIHIFEQEGFQRYETEYLLPFLEHVVNTYLQNQCLLSDGRVGTIVYINHDHLSKPTVLCDGTFVELAKYPDLKIVKLI